MLPAWKSPGPPDMECVVRGLKNTDTPIRNGLQTYHNFIRPHESLNGDTSADRASIKVEGENKWLALIPNASRKAHSPDGGKTGGS